MKTTCLILAILATACDAGPTSSSHEGDASGKADDASLVCAEHTDSPLDGRSLEDMERTGKDPRVLATEAHIAELETAARSERDEPPGSASLLLQQLATTAEHFGRENARDLIDTADSGVSAGQMAYGDAVFDIVIFFEDQQSHGLAFPAGTLEPIGEIGINYDIVGCKRS